MGNGKMNMGWLKDIATQVVVGIILMICTGIAGYWLANSNKVSNKDFKEFVCAVCRSGTLGKDSVCFSDENQCLKEAAIQTSTGEAYTATIEYSDEDTKAAKAIEGTRPAFEARSTGYFLSSQNESRFPSNFRIVDIKKKNDGKKVEVPKEEWPDLINRLQQDQEAKIHFNK